MIRNCEFKAIRSRVHAAMVVMPVGIAGVLILTSAVESLPLPAFEAPILGTLVSAAKAAIVGYLSFCLGKFISVLNPRDIGRSTFLIVNASAQRADGSEPPTAAEFFVGLFVKKRYRNGILQNLAEDFHDDIASGMSLRRANLRYCAAALNSVGPQLWAAAKRLGLIGIFADYARRLLH